MIYLPYLIERIEDGRYVVLNRRHKPLGIHTTERIEYAPYAVRLPGLTEKQAQVISHNGSADIQAIHLYSDTRTPLESEASWSDYQQRLAAFGRLRAE